jgi:hypothetical protein
VLLDRGSLRPVRKRVIISLITVVVAGLGIYVFAQPREGTLEWHKKEYLAAMESTMGPSGWDTVIERCSAMVGRRIDTVARHNRAFDVHAAELEGLGYLERRWFVVSNEPLPVVQAAEKASRDVVAKNQRRFARFTWGIIQGTNIVGLIATREDMTKWAELIRQADAP